MARGFTWAPRGKAVDGAAILDGTIGGSKIVSGDPATQGGSQSNGFMDNLGKIAMYGLAGVAAYSLFNKYGSKLFGSGEAVRGGGNDEGTTSMEESGYFWSDYEDQSGAYYEEGDTMEYVYDATPPQDEPYTVMADVGFSDYGYDDWDFGDGGWSDYA